MKVNLLFLLVFCASGFSAFARDDFYVKSDIRCENDICYFKENNKLFEGDLRRYNLKGKLWFIEEYRDGVKHGEQKYFFDNGNMKSITLFKKGKKHGIDKEYYESGFIKEEKEYDEGLLDGFVRKFFESGKLKEECFFEKDVKDGRCRTFYEKGGLKTDVVYEKGNKVSSYCISEKGYRNFCDAE